MRLSILVSASCLASAGAFTAMESSARNTYLSAASSAENEHDGHLGRRELFRNLVTSAGTAALVMSPLPSINVPVANAAGDATLDDLPREAQRSYTQYRVPLQISADYYLWELRDKISRIDDWGEVNELYRVNNNKGQGQPSRIERDYINPMRILTLSMPPDAADDLRAAQFEFERAAAGLSKITAGVRRDLPVEILPSAQKDALVKWEEGRVALNKFFAVLNDTTGLNELKPVPAAGPNQNQEYGRSEKRYFELMKKTKLCQNRGGPALSQAWGQLMVSGYLQDSCGIPDMDTYFYQ